MKSHKYLVVALLAFAINAGAQERPAADGKAVVAWMTIEEAMEKSKVEKKKIFVDVFTDWCGWCKVMDRETFSDPEVAKVLNEKFYPVKLNAETKKEDIVFNGTTFKYVETSPGRGVHQFAAALLQNQLSYPTVVFLSEEFGMIAPMPGFKKPEEFHVSLSFVASDAFKTMSIEDYVKKTYKSPYASNGSLSNGGN
jgi:thioredoxin-related protein